MTAPDTNTPRDGLTDAAIVNIIRKHWALWDDVPSARDMVAAVREAIAAHDQRAADREARPAPASREQMTQWWRWLLGHDWNGTEDASGVCLKVADEIRLALAASTPPAEAEADAMADQPEMDPRNCPPAEAQPVALSGKWEGAEYWMPLAWALCADECGEDACSELVWEGGPVPEPWGDRWLKYEDEAKRMIALVRKTLAATQPAGETQADDFDALFADAGQTADALDEQSGLIENDDADEARLLGRGARVIRSLVAALARPAAGATLPTKSQADGDVLHLTFRSPADALTFEADILAAHITARTAQGGQE